MANTSTRKPSAAKRSAAKTRKRTSKKTTRQTVSQSKQSGGQTAKKHAAKKSSTTTAAKRAAGKTTKSGTKQKTTARKAAAKKAAKQNAASKQEGRVLVCARDGECFWTSDGQILRDLAELRDALTQMLESVYRYHVTKEKNDFADWVEQVLGDAACAAALRRARKPNTARSIVVRHLRTYAL